MRRRTMHLLFAAVAAAGALGVAVQAWQWRAAERLNGAIAAARTAAQFADLTDADPPEARFAQAVALAAAGENDAAIKAYKALAQAPRGAIRRAALYNLGNLYLRDALKNGAEDAARAMPLIELAKQCYRDVLRADPDAWDARYNLERALWLAPESEDTQLDDEEPPVAPERSVTTMQGERMDLP